MNVQRTEAGPPGGIAPPKAEGPPEGFDALLALHEDEARTATAEGQKKDRGAGHDRGVRAHGDPSRTPGHLRRAEHQADGDTTSPAPSPGAETPSPSPSVAEEAGTPAPLEGDAPAAVPAADPAVAPAAAEAPVAPAVPVDAVAVAPAAAPAPLDGTAAQPATATTTAAQAAAASAAPAGAEAVSAPAPAPVDADAVAGPAGPPVPGAAVGDALPAGDAAATPLPTSLPVDEPVATASLQTIASTAPAPDSAVSPAAGPVAATAEGATEAAPAAPVPAPAAAAPAATAAPTAEDAPTAPTSPNAKGARAAEVHEALSAGERPGPASEAPAQAPVGQAPAAAPAAHSAPHARLAAATHGLRMAETALQLRDLAHVAASRGAAHARLQLHPAELGGIEVRLRVTQQGLTASIAADRPEAVQALQAAGNELRRSLEQRGLTVLSVDVALAGPAGGQTPGQNTQAGGDRSAGAQTNDRTGGQEAAAIDAMEADPTAPRGVPAGALVDILA